jgi:glycosyltransferase involved in cell wall biosynthesis
MISEHLMSSARPRVLILGTRGVPAAHGGFETFAEKLALFLAQRGWQVTVYCQQDVQKVNQRIAIDTWRGIERVKIQVARTGPPGTVEFDWHCVRHAGAQDAVCLVLGYNTAALLVLLRIRKKKMLINMDGIEWLRPKWSWPVRCWFYCNEWIGAWLGDRLIADHPVIADHLATRCARSKITVIPYGGDAVTTAPAAIVEAMGLVPQNYFVSIARLEPDNNVLEIVCAFSRRSRGAKLVVVGGLDEDNPYHASIEAAASGEVLFPGAIYDKTVVRALRFHARAYCHGHMVGGTNPSLVESLWCGNAVLAHRNPYNLWTAGPDQFYFSDADECAEMIERILVDDAAVMRAARSARARAMTGFAWDVVLPEYERELTALGGRATSEQRSPRSVESPRRVG